MNILRICKSTTRQRAACLAMLVVVTLGCNDLTSQNESPAFNSLSNQTHEASRPAGATSASDPQQGTPERGAPGELAETAAARSKPAAGTNEPATFPAGTSPLLTNPPAPKPPIAIPADEPAEIYKPEVILSEAHERTCLVKVGDTLPNLELQRLTGESVTLDEIRGDQLTVVLFWTNRSAYAKAEFDRLATDVALPFLHLGVKVVAVNVGDPVEQIEVDDVTKDQVVCVLDPDGSAVAKVATSKLPRTYLLDGKGRILWFDIEYSRMTRRQLKNAIFFYSRGEDAAS